MSFIINGEEFHHIYLFGDSHLKCFGKKSLNNKKYSLFNCYKSGASMKGLTNQDSTLNYNNEIITKLDKINRDILNKNICVFKFGQVDIEYNIHYKINYKKERIDVNKFIRTIVNNYINYILIIYYCSYRCK